MGSMMATTEVAQTASAYGTASTTTAQPVGDHPGANLTLASSSNGRT